MHSNSSSDRPPSRSLSDTPPVKQTNRGGIFKSSFMRAGGAVLAAALTFTAIGILAPLEGANAATINPDDESSWSEALRDGLAGDTVPITEGTGQAPWQTNYSVQSSSVGGTVTWDKNINVQDGSFNPWLYDVQVELAKAYGEQNVDFPNFSHGQEFDSGDIPGAIPGFTFRWDANKNSLVYIDCDYTRMTPLATAKDADKVTIPGIGEWTLPHPLDFKNMETVPLGNKSFETSFVPAKNYAGVVPPLPVYISNGKDSTSVKYLTTKPTNTARYLVMMSSAFGSAPQQAPYQANNIFNNLRQVSTDNWILTYSPYGLLNPNDPDGTEASSTLKKDGGTYSVDLFGVVTFTPDPGFNNFGTQTIPGQDRPNDPGRLEGVEVVTMTVKGQKYDPNDNQILGETTPLYQLPKNDARRSWAVRMYQPLVLQETVEVSNVEAFGKIGSPITATPDYSQDSGMPAIDLRSVSFVDGPNGEYPAAAQRTKKVDGEGTWTINDNGSFTFTPETGFAGHPSSVYYKAKNVNGIVSADDGDDNDGRTGVGIVTYTYSDSSGLYANTTGPQGEAQTSFDTTDPDDAGFKDAKAMFRNIPDDWFDSFTYKLRGADAEGKVVVDGQGTYTIDANTGKVTFTPLASYSGTAQPAYIEIASGYRNANGQIGSPSAIYTPTVMKSPVVVRPQFGSGPIGAEITVTPDYTQPDGLDPIEKVSITFLNEDGSYPDAPIKSRTIAGQGEWTIDDDGNFTFTPVPGFAGDPAQQPYTAKNTKGVFAAPANVGVVYGGVVTLPSTTVGPQNTVQHSDDTDASDNGLTRDEMFPNLPEDWFTDNGGPLTTKLVNANGDLVDTVTVDGKGTYTIAPNTGKVTFTPIATFVGKADPVTIAVDGLKYASGKSVPVRTTYTPFISKTETVLPNAFEQAKKTGEPWSVTPSYQDGGYNIDPKTATFPDGSRTKKVDGEGTWTINPDTGEFTFTPEVGFNGTPKPVSYDAVNAENGLKATGGQVTIIYPQPFTKPATTAAEQGITQLSTDNGNQDAGLTPADMFPTVPADWYGEEDSPVKFHILDGEGNQVQTLTVHTKDHTTGEDIEAGTYTIDEVTGIVTFAPNPQFLGAAPSATIVTEGLSENLRASYTPFYYPARVELPSDRQEQTVLGAPTSSQFDLGEWKTANFTVDKDTIKMLNADGAPVDGNEYVVPGEGTWQLELVGDAPAPGAEDTREVKFTFTPEPGFIGQPTELKYTASNTNGVASAVPGQVVFVYPQAEPVDAVTTAKQGEVQYSDDKGESDQGLTPEEMFPRISEVPATWNLSFELDGANDAGELTVDGQGTYKIDPDTGKVTFTPEPDFTGTADPATIWVLADGKRTKASAKYTPVVESFGNPIYNQRVVATGGSVSSEVIEPADAPEGAPKYSIDDSFTAPEGWTVNIDENTGAITAQAPKNADQMIAFEVPVTATYPGNVKRNTSAPFSPLKDPMGSPSYLQKVVKQGETVDSTITPPDDAPEGKAKYSIDPSFTVPAGWKVSLDEETGTVTAEAPQEANLMVAFEVPVIANYPNNEMRTTRAPFSPIVSFTRSIQYETEVVLDDTLNAGEKRETGGEMGEETYTDGKWEVTTKPVKKVVRVGVKPPCNCSTSGKPGGSNNPDGSAPGGNTDGNNPNGGTAGGSLPDTGFDGTWMIALSIFFVGAGGALMLRRRYQGK